MNQNIEPDINSIVAKAATELLKDMYSSITSTVSSPISKIITILFRTFENYNLATYTRCKYIKNIIIKDRPVDINEIYVPGFFKCNDEKISDNDLISAIRDGRDCIISGSGGIGKSIFMKNAWLTIAQEPKGKVPVFIELRKLNQLESPDLLSFIRQSLSAGSSDFSQENFSTLVKEGRFIFLLDGFDEIKKTYRESMERQIIEISSLYPKCGIAVSSRQDERFQSWQSFHIFNSCPFEKDQIVDLINKTPYDKAIKKNFLNKLKKSDYLERNNSFLQNPLLCTMMLITFDQFADVPDKIHIFYEYAFLALFRLHDSTKETFDRELTSGLDIEEFRRFLSYFCLITYFENKLEFEETELSDFIKQALKHSDVKTKSEFIIDDLIQNVNLMQRDGLLYTFIHRSFQEYFVSYCITKIIGTKSKDIIWSISDRHTDLVLKMSHQMAPDIIEELYVVEGLELYSENFQLLNNNDVSSKFLFLNILECELHADELSKSGQWSSFGSSVRSDFLRFCNRVASLYDDPSKHDKSQGITLPGIDVIFSFFAKKVLEYGERHPDHTSKNPKQVNECVLRYTFKNSDHFDFELEYTNKENYDEIQSIWQKSEFRKYLEQTLVYELEKFAHEYVEDVHKICLGCRRRFNSKSKSITEMLKGTATES